MTDNRINTLTQTLNQRQEISDANATVLPSTAVFAVKTLTAPRIITLPDVAAYSIGFPLTIADESGNCSATNTITIKNGAGVTLATLTRPNAAVVVLNTGTKWLSQDVTSEIMTAHLNNGPLATILSGFYVGNPDDSSLMILQLAKVKGSPLALGSSFADEFVNQAGFSPAPFVETVQSLPAMTSATTPSGHVVSASSQLNTTSYAAYIAFNQNTANEEGWHSSNSSLPQWLQRQTPIAITLGGYRIRSRGDGYSERCPTAFTLLGSNDNFVTSSILDSRSGLSWTTGETKAFTIPVANRGAFLYHRLNMTANTGADYTSLMELEFLQGANGESINIAYDTVNKVISNTAPATPYVPVSSEYISSGDFQTFYKSNAFDSDPVSQWSSSQNGVQLANVSYIGILRAAGSTVTLKSMTAVVDWLAPGVFAQYTDDGSNWVSYGSALTSQGNVIASYTYPLDGKPHRGWRLFCTQNRPGGESNGFAVRDFTFLSSETLAPMDLRSTTSIAPYVPTKGSIFFLARVITDTANPNVNLLAKLSRDDGINYATASLIRGVTLPSGLTIFKATEIDLSGQLNSKNVKWRIQTVGSTLAIALDGVLVSISSDPPGQQTQTAVSALVTPYNSPIFNTIGY